MNITNPPITYWTKSILCPTLHRDITAKNAGLPITSCAALRRGVLSLVSDSRSWVGRVCADSTRTTLPFGRSSPQGQTSLCRWQTWSVNKDMWRCINHRTFVWLPEEIPHTNPLSLCMHWCVTFQSNHKQINKTSTIKLNISLSLDLSSIKTLSSHGKLKPSA